MFNQNNTLSISTGSMIRFLLVLLGFFLVWVLRDLVLVVLTSIVVASFMESTVPFLKKIKLGRVFGMAIVYLILIFTIHSMITLNFFSNLYFPFIHYSSL